MLRDELSAHKARAQHSAPGDPVFATPSGRARDKDNIRNRVLAPAIKRANELLEAADLAALPNGLSPHSLRRTFASILVALGEDPRYVMGQLGHASPNFTLRVYAQAMHHDDGARDRLRALVEGAELPPLGTSAETSGPAGEATAKPEGANLRDSGDSSRWAVPDSNWGPPACKAGALAS